MRTLVYHKPSPHTLHEPVREAVLEMRGEMPVLNGPIVLRLRFIFWRDPAKPRAVPLTEWSTWGLTRAVMNVLPGLLYHEEKQVVAVHATKEYGNINGIEIKC